MQDVVIINCWLWFCNIDWEENNIFLTLKYRFYVKKDLYYFLFNISFLKISQ